MAQTIPAARPRKRRIWMPSVAWRQRAVLALFGVALVSAVSFTLSWHSETTPVAHQNIGEAALTDVVASHPAHYDSDVQRKTLADTAAASPTNIVYMRDNAAVQRMADAYDHMVESVGGLRQTWATATSTDAQAALVADFGRTIAVRLSQAQTAQILVMPDSEWQATAGAGKDALTAILGGDITADTLGAARERLRFAAYAPAMVSPSLASLADKDREIAVSLAAPFIGPNQVQNDTATRDKQDAARKAVPPVPVTIVTGQTIIRRGDVISAETLEELDHLGIHPSGFDLATAAGTVGIVTLLVVALLGYFARIGFVSDGSTGAPPRLRGRLLVFLGAAFWVAAAAARLTLSASLVSPGSLLDGIQAYLFPFATLAIMLAVLFDLEIAIFFTALVALLAGYIGNGIEPAALYFAGGLAGALAIWRAERIASFAYAGVAVAVAEFVTALGFALTRPGSAAWGVAQLAGATLVNGLLSASIAFFGFGLLARFFGVTTGLQLLELAHPTQPLLKRLMREAPGTYHHSMLVGTLAEQAAEAVGADPLLARVGAYFHDIGKLSDPHMFIENQEGGANPHDSLAPVQSRDILRAHVSDGIALARKYGLPRRVADIIGQHHGVAVMGFFYDKALKENVAVSEAAFRYPGPRPQTKEAAIVMLADGVEAAVRAGVQSGQVVITAETTALVAPGPNFVPKKSVRAVVDQIVGERIGDGQLNECSLTLRDIEAIREVFTATLIGIHHSRVVYPEKRPAAPDPQPMPPLNVRVLAPDVPSPADGSGELVASPTALAERAPDTTKPVRRSRIGRAGSAIGDGDATP